MQPVTCDVCGNRVRVEKFSRQHTSVQWSGTGGELCPRLANDSADGGCPALGSSIERAVANGALRESARDEEPRRGRW